jgi:hypothetical protein
MEKTEWILFVVILTFLVIEAILLVIALIAPQLLVGALRLG